MSCPHCGSENLRITGNLNESACNTCGCEFKSTDDGAKVYVCGDFDAFMENVTNEICGKVVDASIISALQGSVKGFLNEGYQSLPSYIEHLTEEAEALYNQFLSGMREKEDFGAIVEGIGQLIKWVQLHEEDYPGYDDEYDDLVDEPDMMGDPDDMEFAGAVADIETDAGDLGMDECGHDMEEPAPAIGGAGIIGVGSMPQIGAIATPGVPETGLPASDDIAMDRAQDAAEQLADALDDLEDASANPPAEQTMGFYESEAFAFSVGDQVYIGNDDSTTYTVIAIHEGRVVAKDPSGMTQTVDLNDEFREVDIQFSREEESAIISERAEASAKNMKDKWLAMEKAMMESDHVDDGFGKGDDTGHGFHSDEGHEEAEDKKHDKDGEVTSSVEDAEDESDSPDYAGNDMDSRHGDQWGLKEEEEKVEETEEVNEDEEVTEETEVNEDEEVSEEEELDESVIGDHFHQPDGTDMPFPFTQDPTNSASEEYKEDKMEEEEQEAEGRAEDAGLKAKDKLEEAALNGLREGDIINKGKDFSTQWTVTKITRGPAKVHLKNGTKTTVMDPMRESFQYIDGVALGYERHNEGIADTKKVWAALEESFAAETNLQPINESKGIEKEEFEVVERESVSKKDLYHTIKEGDYHRIHRGEALQQLVAKFGNPAEEIEAVLDDVCLAENDATIDQAYEAEQLGELDTVFALKHAWSQMEEEIGLEKSAEDQKNGEMGGNPRKSSAEQDVMRQVGSADDLRINFNEGKQWFHL